MRCPYCKVDDDRVLETRAMEDGLSVRRRRQCKRCRKRFTTYEHFERRPILVVKKSGKREPFDRQKLFQAVLKACAKRAIADDRLWEIVDRIEMQVCEQFDKEVPADIEWSRTNPNTVFLAGPYASVYKSMDSGTTWSQILSADKLPK